MAFKNGDVVKLKKHYGPFTDLSTKFVVKADPCTKRAFYVECAAPGKNQVVFKVSADILNEYFIHVGCKGEWCPWKEIKSGSPLYKKLVEKGLPPTIHKDFLYRSNGNKTEVKPLDRTIPNVGVFYSKCSPEDKFDLAYGIALAAARAYTSVSMWKIGNWIGFHSSMKVLERKLEEGK